MFGNSLHIIPSTISFFFVAGEMVTKQPLIRSMRTVKRETLKLISGWVSRSNDPQMVRNCFDILWVHSTVAGVGRLVMKHNSLILGAMNMKMYVTSYFNNYDNVVLSKEQ